MNPENPTPEQIAQHYSAAMDSVNLINDIKAGKYDATMTAKDKLDKLARFLELVVGELLI